MRVMNFNKTVMRSESDKEIDVIKQTNKTRLNKL